MKSFEFPPIELFTLLTRTAWTVVGIFTIVSASASLNVTAHHVYFMTKVVTFFAVGFLCPIAFRSLTAICFSLGFSLISALVLESCQGSFRNGHGFHWHELVGKSMLILFGVAYALDFRYEGRIAMWRFTIPLLARSSRTI